MQNTTRASRRWVVLFTMMVGLSSVSAQAVPAGPALQLSSRSDLRSALIGVPDVFRGELRYALIAAQSPGILPDLHAIAVDDRENTMVRANALMVLAFVLDRPSASVVRQIAIEAGPLQTYALAALQFFPYPESCQLWRDALRDPDAIPHVEAFAPSGISFCGDEGDIALLDSLSGFFTPGRRADIMRVYMPRLRSAMADRYRGTFFEGNYPPSGRYTPSPAILSRLTQELCDGSCPAGMVVSPEAFARLRASERGPRQ